MTVSIVVERGNMVVDGTGYGVEGDGTGNGFSLQNIVNVRARLERRERRTKDTMAAAKRH